MNARKVLYLLNRQLCELLESTFDDPNLLISDIKFARLDEKPILKVHLKSFKS